MPPPSRPHRAPRPPRRGPRPGRPLPPPPLTGPDGAPQVALTPRGAERWQSGHPWIYRADLAAVPQLAGGEVVRVVDPRGWFLGKAFYSSTSKISLRWMSFEDVEIGPALLGARIAQADALRRALYPGESTYRVIHGEADLLPGLVVDRYGDVLSVQFLVQATEARRELLTDLLVAHFQPRGVMDRSDVHVRTLEGLEPRRAVLRGEVPERVEYAEGLVRVSADVQAGQKTGAFLDQRENHELAATYARGEALDCFSYLGGFALQLATRATKVTAVEISEQACEALRRNVERNGFRNVEVVTANAFDFLRDAVDEGRRFDTIVLDPPSFAKNKDAIESAVRGYKEINLRALQLLAPGGILMTASCTYHVDEERFEAMLASAAADARRRVQIVERRGAARDHPVLTALRETRYLKFYVLRVID
ncbi:MAG TPA: class I SAM-dependent rRNA methyltransferase [Myxococcaceae bacterium]|nr:class I SAM-dependent rRNA methyltransferase [Myxococcaceae bacterium]